MLSPARITCALLAGLALNSCSSSHNLAEGGEGTFGGGYLVDPVSENVYQITAKTNVAQWTDHGTARRMWKKHAEEACKGRPYVEGEVKEYTYEAQPQYLWNKYIVTVKEGQAQCSSTNLGPVSGS